MRENSNNESGNASRDSGRQPLFLGLDGRAILLFGIWMFHWSIITFILASGSFVFFWILKYMGINMDYVFRYMRWWFFGRLRIRNTYEFDEVGE